MMVTLRQSNVAMGKIISELWILELPCLMTRGYVTYQSGKLSLRSTAAVNAAAASRDYKVGDLTWDGCNMGEIPQQ